MTIRKKQNKLDQRTKIIMIIVLIFVVILAFSYVNLRQKSKKDVYKRQVLLHVWERLKGFIIKAGTILFLACVVMWFLSGYGFVNGSFGAVEDPGNSLLAVIGGAIAPIFAPLGFGNWKAVAASLSGFSAKESIVSTMGVLANITLSLIHI